MSDFIAQKTTKPTFNDCIVWLFLLRTIAIKEQAGAFLISDFFPRKF